MTQDLIQGAAEFKHYHYETDNALMKQLAELGQDPKYFIISCIDSRCNPYTIFRAPPGLFFTHKAMGAIVRPYKQGTALAAALQFAIYYNKIETVIVLGHTKCGAVKALTENLQDDEISEFIKVAQHALQNVSKSCAPSDLAEAVEKEVILESTENLKAYPSVARALKEKKITVQSWLFDIADGNLSEYDEADKAFHIINNSIETKESRNA